MGNQNRTTGDLTSNSGNAEIMANFTDVTGRITRIHGIPIEEQHETVAKRTDSTR
ncbi:hypothetical protein [Xenorhabdus doucetiae]|uniref:hypothetical protein n=1 Tax=Xenorhabdus doucetiae TaxID=351671 RepID=UPI002B40D5A1|nr:hypothetical protein [Xenorhabdus sp. 3]